MGRYASIDIGSNSTLLLIVERRHNGGVRVLVDTKLSTKLSFGAASGNSITGEGIERQFTALDRVRELLGNYHVNQIVVCATQVFRVAGNGPALAAEISRRYGWKVEIIDGKREAEYSYFAAASGLDGIVSERVVFDVGGGSSEVVFGNGDQIHFARSFPLGAVKLTEACGMEGRIDEGKLAAARSHTGQVIPAESVAVIPPGSRAIAVGGTAATLAALKLERQVFDPALIHGVLLSRKWLESTTLELAEMTAEERRRRLVFDPDRAEIIVAGGLILNYLLQMLRCGELIVSNRGLRWGVLLTRFGELAEGVIKQQGDA